MLKEHERQADHYKNRVDKERSYLNWGYGCTGNVDDIILNIKKRCWNIMDGKQMQKHTNIMSEWVVTYPFHLCDKVKDSKGHIYHRPKDPEHCRKFFDVVWEFMSKRYGKDNMVCAYVHMDETTPHIQADFVPEAISRKTGERTVSSASLLTRTELKMFQKDLEKEMVEVFGKSAKGYILNGQTKRNLTTDELKDRSAWLRHVNKREKEVTRRENDVSELEKKQKEEAKRLENWEIQLKAEAVTNATNAENNRKKEEELKKKEEDIKVAAENNAIIAELNEKVDRQLKEREKIVKAYENRKSKFEGTLNESKTLLEGYQR